MSGFVLALVFHGGHNQLLFINFIAPDTMVPRRRHSANGCDCCCDFARTHTHDRTYVKRVYTRVCVCVCLVRSVRRPRNVINCTCKQKKRTKTNVLLSFKITRRRTGGDGGNARVHFSASWVLLFCGGACVLLPRKRARGVPCGPSRYISRTVAAAAFFIPGSALPMWRTDVPTECRPVQP